MSFWYLNAADPVADAIYPNWHESAGPDFATGVGFSQRAVPTFFELTTGPVLDLVEPLYDPSALGTFLLSRLYTHSAGLWNGPTIRGAQYDKSPTEFTEWASLEVGDDLRSRWRVVCRSLWILPAEGSAVPYRAHGWWVFWGTWDRTVISSPPFAYGSNLEPDADDWNPCFGGRREATGRNPDYPMPAWVDVKPWFP